MTGTITEFRFLDAPCTIPYEDRAPTNGALICASSSQHYPEVCRIHCREGYELRNYDSRHKFVCRWDGSWNLEGDRWPECMSKHEELVFNAEHNSKSYAFLNFCFCKLKCG